MTLLELQTAHIVIEMFRAIPEACNVEVIHVRDDEQIKAIVDYIDYDDNMAERVRYYTFQIGSDSDEYVFVNNHNSSDVITFADMPENLMLNMDI